MSEKDQSVNNTEEDFNVETEDNQNDTNLSLIHISEPTRLSLVSRMPSSA